MNDWIPGGKPQTLGELTEEVRRRSDRELGPEYVATLKSEVDSAFAQMSNSLAQGFYGTDRSVATAIFVRPTRRERARWWLSNWRYRFARAWDALRGRDHYDD